MTEPEPAFLEEGAKRLNAYCGIAPLENARDAVHSIWTSLLHLCEGEPDCWGDVEPFLAHPQLQATIAYYRAIGPWRVSQGLAPSPAVLPDEEMEDMQEDMAELTRAALFDDVAEPSGAAVGSKARVHPPREFVYLSDELCEALVETGQKALRYNDERGENDLVHVVSQVAQAIRISGKSGYDVYVKQVTKYSQLAYKIINIWLERVRHLPECRGLYIKFEFRSG